MSEAKREFNKFVDEQLEIEYAKLTKEEKDEFQKAYAKGTLNVASPKIHGILKTIYQKEETMKEAVKKEEALKPGEVVVQQKGEALEDVIARAEKGKPQALVVHEKKDMSLADLKELGKILYTSRMFTSVLNENQAIAKILKGRELGLGAMASLEKIYVVNGKTAIESGLMADLIKRTNKYNYKILELTNSKCVIEFTENNKVVGKSEFSIEDANRAGLSSKDIWRKYPRNMLFGRALSNGARWYCPDALNGASYTTEELDFDDSKPQVVEAITIEPDMKPEQPKPEVVKPKKDKVEKIEDAEIKNDAVEPEKVETREEAIRRLKTEYGEEKMKEVRNKLKLGKLREIDKDEWNKFLKELTGVDF